MRTIEDELSERILGAAIEVHSTLGGPGLLESVYEEALVVELAHRGLRCKSQVACSATYKGVVLRSGFRVDLLVEDLVVVECKATANDHPVHMAQALTYLRMLGLRLALVLNFRKPVLKDGIRRVVNRL